MQKPSRTCLLALAVVGGICTLSLAALSVLNALGVQHATYCSGAPKQLSREDLIGTWWAGTSEHSDTLVIREDGTYQQIVHHEFPGRPPIDYVSAWQSWWLETTPVPVVHLKGWSYCGYNSEVDCRAPAHGPRDNCNGSFTRIPEEEGLFYVHGGPEITLDAPLGELGYAYWRTQR
jgi:hypothetical protein